MRYVFFTFLFYGVMAVWAQVDTFLGVSIQNDFLNYRGHGTDRYYTGGNQAALFIVQPQEKITHQSFMITQQVYTPADLQDTAIRYFDYPYAGLLFLTYRVQHRPVSSKTSWAFSSSLGYSGRRSGARQTQQFLHRAIGDEIPLGWDHIVNNGFFAQFEFLLAQPLVTIPKASAAFYQSIEMGSLFQRVRWGVSFVIGTASMPMGSFAIFPRTRSAAAKYSLASFITPTITRVFKNFLLKGATARPIEKSRIICEQIAGLEFGLQVSSQFATLQFVQYLQEREFEQAGAHAFGEISLRIPLHHKIQ
jgi:lipid A 3-O-deacylase